MGFVVKRSRFDDFLSEIHRKYRIYAPVCMQGKGRFSDTDLIRYQEIVSSYDIVVDKKSTFSPKDIIFPKTQTLFQFTENEYKEPGYDDRGILIFLRPCDINGIKRLDTIFLKNGGFEDTYYKRLRKNVKYAMIECKEGFDNCFCVSMDTNKTDDYAMAVRFGEKEILLDVKDEFFLKCLDKSYPTVDFTPEFVLKNNAEVFPPDIDKMSNWVFDHELWDEYKARCIACGRCNTTCITCSCFSTKDIFFDDNPNMGERRRVWASCHVDGFTEIAGGHSFRKDNSSRMRFKTMHKIYDFKKRFGENMCVGCGRCDDNCPEYISFANCINKLNDVL